jgi:hypothetical protein
MKRTHLTRNAFVLVCFIFLAGFTFRLAGKVSAGGASDSLPVPKNVKDLLFYVQRDPDANTVIYQLNRNAEGQLDEAEPISIFWIRYAQGGVRKELNYIQRKFAYGLNTKKLAKDHYEVTFVSYDKLKLYLRKNSQGAFQVYTRINQEQAPLDRVFVRIEGGTFWVPNVLYVELKGREAASGKAVMERFKP